MAWEICKGLFMFFGLLMLLALALHFLFIPIAAHIIGKIENAKWLEGVKQREENFSREEDLKNGSAVECCGHTYDKSWKICLVCQKILQWPGNAHT